MMSFNFGPGECIVTPLTDTYGNTIAVPTPRRLGGFQDANFDSSAEVKMMYGSNGYPIAVGTGKGKSSLKLKLGQISVDQVNAIFAGQPLNQTAVMEGAVLDNTGILIPATPYTITAIDTVTTPLTQIAIPNSGVWDQDLGVQDGNGNAYQCVATGPTTGQYTVAAGVYVFAAADVGKKVFISFGYNAASTTSKKLIVQNAPMGNRPNVMVDLITSFDGPQFRLKLYKSIATKITLASKLDDFTYPEIDLDGFADSSNNIFMIAGAQ